MIHTHPLGTHTLEMVAVALSEEYGIRVVCNGRRAQTTLDADGKVCITLPSVNFQNADYFALLRGYIDHEVGHLRHTDNTFLTNIFAQHMEIIGSLKTVSHIFEDILVERLMGESYPGCRRNLRKLLSLVLGTPKVQPVPAADILQGLADHCADQLRALPYQLWAAVAQYILYRVRGESFAPLKLLIPRFQEPLDLLAPGLIPMLGPVLARVQTEGISTQANVALARDVLRKVQEYFWQHWQWPVSGEGMPHDFLPRLAWVLRNGGGTGDSVDLGKISATVVDDMLSGMDELTLDRNITVHHPYGSPLWRERILLLNPTEQKEALQTSAMMDAQLQSLLQAYTLNRSGPVKNGRLNTNTLYKLFTCNNNIFYKNTHRRKLNTEIVVAIDMSGSMSFSGKSDMASKALYSVTYSLMHIKGISFSCMGFFDNNVIDIIRRGGRVSPRVKIVPGGGTLCGNALKHAIQLFSASADSRKIVMMLTDGDANDPEEFQATIARAQRAHVEFLGIGILDTHILQYLPQEHCCVIKDVRQLAVEMLRMLQKSLCSVA